MGLCLPPCAESPSSSSYSALTHQHVFYVLRNEARRWLWSECAMGLPTELEARLRSMVIEQLGETRSRLWFGDEVQLSISDRVLEVGVPNQFFQDWIERHFTDTLREATATLTGHALEIAFSVRPESTANEEQNQPSSLPTSASTLTSRTHLASSTQRSHSRGHNGQRLENFVTGPGNSLAHAAAVELVHSSGELFNPLLIHGGIGLGKSFLLAATHQAFQKHEPRFNSAYLTAENFTNTFLEAMRSGTLVNFRARFRRLRALMLDDVQFLAAKRATQDEFLHTFNALIGMGAPVVLASDRHPKLIPKLAGELVTRLLSGMIVKLEPPDLTTRLAILRAKANARNATIPETVVSFIAQHIRSNVRELEGALCTVLTHSHLTNRPIDLTLARLALRDTIRLTAQVIALEDIERAVCQFFELKPEVLKSDGRIRSISYPRMLAMYLARKHTGATYSEIGHYFGGRNHSTVIAAERKLNTWLRSLEQEAFLPGMESVAEVLAAVERGLSL